MTIKVYVSLLSGNYEVKKRQQRIQTVLDSCAITYELIDITEAGCEDERKFMQETAKAKEGDRNPLPPQIFNNKDYCGDYDGFDLANETDQLHQFLKLSEGEVNTAQDILTANRRSSSKERSTAENGLDAAPEHNRTDANEEASFWDDKKEDDSPGFWDEKEEDNPVKEEKKEEVDSPGFWDQKEESPVKELKNDADDSPGFWDQKEESPAKEVKKEEDESPGFWDQQEAEEKTEDDGEKEKATSKRVEAEPVADVEVEEEESEEQEDDESPDLAELKDVAQRLPGSADAAADSDTRDAKEDSPGFWDQNAEDDLPARSEKKEESLGFWDENTEDIFPTLFPTKNEKESPNFWDQHREDVPIREEEKESSPGFWDDREESPSVGMANKDESPGFWEANEEDAHKDGEKKETPGFWEDKNEDVSVEEKNKGESPGFWDDNSEKDVSAKEEKKGESPGFWDQKGEDVPVREEGKEESPCLWDESKGVDVPVRGGTPGFWDENKAEDVPVTETREEESPALWDTTKEEDLSIPKETESSVSYWDDKGEEIPGKNENEGGGSGFWNEGKNDDTYMGAKKRESPALSDDYQEDAPVREERKEESPGFWDDNTGQPIPASEKKKDDTLGFGDAFKEESVSIEGEKEESPGFWEEKSGEVAGMEESEDGSGLWNQNVEDHAEIGGGKGSDKRSVGDRGYEYKIADSRLDDEIIISKEIDETSQEKATLRTDSNEQETATDDPRGSVGEANKPQDEAGVRMSEVTLATTQAVPREDDNSEEGAKGEAPVGEGPESDMQSMGSSTGVGHTNSKTDDEKVAVSADDNEAADVSG